jgi:acyl carrier protein
MTPGSIEDRIRTVLAKALGIEASSIDEAFSPDVTDSWDSLGHISLILALEKEFSIRFDEHDMMDLLSYRGILKIITMKM